MENRICVYAIAKNEAHHVDAWYESMKEADCIVVLDTGSTDDTVEKLKSHGIIVEQKQYEQFRFDVARNDSLALVPEEYNILVCTDLDEYFEPGWADCIKRNWCEGKHTRGMYDFVWSKTENVKINYDKIHTRDYKWKYPVHEFLVRDSSEYYSVDEQLDLRGQVTLHHNPDDHSRHFYLELLKLRNEEYKDTDLMGYVYLAREYTFNHMYEEAIKVAKQGLIKFFYAPEEKSCLYGLIGKSYFFTGNMEEAVVFFTKQIMTNPKGRNGYANMAMLLLDGKVNKPDIALSVLKNGLKNTLYDGSWTEDESLWTWQYYDWMCVASYQVGSYESALAYSEKALSASPNNEHIKSNRQFCLDKIVRE